VGGVSAEEVRRAELLRDAEWAASVGDPEQQPRVDYLTDQVERLRQAESGASPAQASELNIVTLDEFAAVEEPGADALVGDTNGAVIPESGDVMFYGDGGAGKTTLCIDLACHLAAGDDWLGLPVARTARVLLVENEGPRPLFRVKLKRKRDGWVGSPIGDRVVASSCSKRRGLE
jgi:AAA domain